MIRDQVQSWDVAVIGGGIVGTATALHLQGRGRRVVIIDPCDPEGRASFGNGGAINHCSVLTVASPSVWPNLLRYALHQDMSVRIRWRSLSSFARWLPVFLASSNASAWRKASRALEPLTGAAYDHHMELARVAGSESLVCRAGYMKLYRTESGYAAAALEREILSDAGVKAVQLDRAAVRDLQPSLKDVFVRGTLFPDSGAVNTPGHVVEAYWRAYKQRGGGVVRGQAARLRPVADSVEIEGPAGRITAGHVVVSAGAASGELLAPLGLRFPLAAERGYHSHVKLQPGAAVRYPFHDVAGGYAVAVMGDEVRVMSGIELAGMNDPPNLEQLKGVLARASEIMPIVPAGDRPFWIGSRPSIADGLPVIGPAPGAPRIMLAFGHGHIGLSTGPITGRIVADMICGERPPIPTEPFRAERFRYSSVLPGRVELT